MSFSSQNLLEGSNTAQVWAGFVVVPVHNHAMRNEDTIQISRVVCWVAEEVQTVAGPVIPNLGEDTGQDTCHHF